MDQIVAVTKLFSGFRSRIGHFMFSGIEPRQEVGQRGGRRVVNSSGLNLGGRRATQSLWLRRVRG